MILRKNMFMIFGNSSAFQGYLKLNISSSISVRSQHFVQHVQIWLNPCNIIGWPKEVCDWLAQISSHTHCVNNSSPHGCSTAALCLKIASGTSPSFLQPIRRMDSYFVKGISTCHYILLAPDWYKK